MLINKNLYNIGKGDSFAKVSKRIADFKSEHPDIELYNLGVGDVSVPIAIEVAEGIKRSANKLLSSKTFYGYGHYYGLDRLRQKIFETDYKKFNNKITVDNIYISDGTKSDAGNILELFDANAKILIPKVCYPIYEASALATGHANITFGEVDSDFKMMIPKEKFDIIYICSPTNPVGNKYEKADLIKWQKYCEENEAVIIYDNVYWKFSDEDTSIYNIDGMEKCAIEMRSFSKVYSYTGERCSYYVIPEGIMPGINELWKLRTMNRFNGPSFSSQCGLLAGMHSPSAQAYIDNNIKRYKVATLLLGKSFIHAGYKAKGGTDAPYVFIQDTSGKSSWEVFEDLLVNKHIIVIPGCVFGADDGWFRVSGLANITDILSVVQILGGSDEH